MMPATQCVKAEEQVAEKPLTMSVTTEARATAAQPYDDETPTAEVRYDFKNTEENRTKTVAVSLNEESKEFITEMSLRSARWRSVSQFVNDALVYYVNGEGSSVSADTIVDGVEWSSEHNLAASVTETLHREIKILVNHGHTPWTTIQEFATCALFQYIDSNMPSVEAR